MYTVAVAQHREYRWLSYDSSRIFIFNLSPKRIIIITLHLFQPHRVSYEEHPPKAHHGRMCQQHVAVHRHSSTPETMDAQAVKGIPQECVHVKGSLGEPQRGPIVMRHNEA